MYNFEGRSRKRWPKWKVYWSRSMSLQHLVEILLMWLLTDDSVMIVLTQCYQLMMPIKQAGGDGRHLNGDGAVSWPARKSPRGMVRWWRSCMELWSCCMSAINDVELSIWTLKNRERKSRVEREFFLTTLENRLWKEKFFLPLSKIASGKRIVSCHSRKSRVDR